MYESYAVLVFSEECNAYLSLFSDLGCENASYGEQDNGDDFLAVWQITETSSGHEPHSYSREHAAKSF